MIAAGFAPSSNLRCRALGQTSNGDWEEEATGWWRLGEGLAGANISSTVVSEVRWHRPHGVLGHMGVINHLLGSVPSTLNPLDMFLLNGVELTHEMELKCVMPYN